MPYLPIYLGPKFEDDDPSAWIALAVGRAHDDATCPACTAWCEYGEYHVGPSDPRWSQRGGSVFPTSDILDFRDAFRREYPRRREAARAHHVTVAQANRRTRSEAAER